MKGRDLCRSFYDEIGEPAIQSSLPKAMATLAIGIATGSQAHGNDDELSRDHGWGPGFAVWLEPGIFAELGHSLQDTLDPK